MFVGRERELATLEEAYHAESFQMIVVYGRRRVGKTTILTQFARGKRALFFTAQQQSDHDNLADFSREVAQFFGLPSGTAFQSWDAAFSYLADRAAEEPFVFIFDEFPYAALANRSIVSKLQVAIDHQFLATRMCLVLCGSNQGFMESEVLGEKSPLHGRRTAQLRVRPFDYLDAAKMLPGVPHEDAFRYYSCIGGVPYYLAQVKPGLTFSQNIARLFFQTDGLLYEEPAMLLRQELREPALYNSILRAVGAGANRQNEIADRAGMEATSVSKYLRTLVELDIIERVVPFGENQATSRRGIYRCKDACYDFWYTFVMPAVGDIEEGAGDVVAASLSEDVLATYLGHRFERVCQQWLLRQAVAGELPIAASTFGSWWGTDPSTREQDDIDVIAADRFAKQALIGECKWRNSFNETQTIERLQGRAGLVRGYEVAHFYLFSKKPLAPATQAKVEADPCLHSVDLSQIYA